MRDGKSYGFAHIGLLNCETFLFCTFYDQPLPTALM